VELVPGRRYEKPADATESWCAAQLEGEAASEVPRWVALYDRLGGRHLGQLVAVDPERGELVVEGINGARRVRFGDVVDSPYCASDLDRTEPEPLLLPMRPSTGRVMAARCSFRVNRAVPLARPFGSSLSSIAMVTGRGVGASASALKERRGSMRARRASRTLAVPKGSGPRVESRHPAQVNVAA
jgi:hypothetical protein